MSTRTRRLADVRAGDEIDSVMFPLPMYRLVMEAGANRDFNSIHHNREYARSTGAPDAYANTLFLMGMWERAVRDWAGPGAVITAIRGFRMGRFNTTGTTCVVRGAVAGVDLATNLVTLSIATASEKELTVGPGEIDVWLPG
jgi:acyl dehydratase